MLVPIRCPLPDAGRCPNYGFVVSAFELRGTCHINYGHCVVLPLSYNVPDGLRETGDNHVASGEFAEWKGIHSREKGLDDVVEKF